LVSVKKPNPKADRRGERRMLLHEERQWLHATTLDRNMERYRISAAERVMPDNSDVAPMLRADLADARQAWLDDAGKAPKEYARREQSDFLLEANFEGEVLDIHALRHTCGAWLAMAGAHPKTVQTVMRHSSITLTMDTYGHLFQGQEADAISRLPEMLGKGPRHSPATGTDGP